jgi:hypothetical protein
MGAELREGLGNAWSMVATFVPKLLGFLVILFIGWLIAKAIAKGLEMVMKRLGFARMMSRAGLDTMTRNSGVDIGGIIVKLAYYFVLLIALQLAFGVFGESNPVSALLNEVIAFLPRILVAIVLIVVAAAVARVVRDLTRGAMGNRPIAPLMSSVAYYIIVVMGVVAALNQVDIATTVTMPVLITVLATIGGVLVVGFGGGLIRPISQRWDGWLERMSGQLGSGAHHASAPQPRTEPAGASAVQQQDMTTSGGMPRP